MVQLIVNAQAMDMPKKGGVIKYTRQIADIFDIASVANSYTNSGNLPKTPNNTRILQQLGIVGDKSTIPYSKVPATLLDGGLPLIQSGWLMIKETSDSYKWSIIDGMIDFFKAIENKSMGSDLNLSEFDHEKSIATVVASFDNDFYKYIIADYNGKNEATVDDETGINIDYLVPSFSVWKLFERVFETFGYTFSTDNIEDLQDLYITYPKAPSETIVSTLFAELIKGLYVIPAEPDGEGNANSDSQNNWTSVAVIQGTVIDNWSYQVPESGVYRLDTIVEAYADYRVWNGEFLAFPYPVNFQVYINGDLSYSFLTDPFNPVSSSKSIYLSEGDIVFTRLSTPVTIYQDGGYFNVLAIHHNSTNFKVYRTNQGSIILNEAFKNYKIKDFIKECFWFCAVTPIIDVTLKHVSFVSLIDRLDFNRADDWTDKYVKRVSETYSSGLAQKNIFRHQYTDPKDSYQDGYLLSDNKNAPAEQIIVASKLYAPENITHQFFDAEGVESFTTKKFTVWARESKEDSEGVVSVEYKGLNERFYFMKLRMSEESEWLLTSESVIGSDTVEQLPYADTKGTTYSQIVPEKYAPYSGVLNNFRCHDIDLKIGLMDFLSADLTRPKYFGQEGMYYLLNKLDYTDGKISGGEFIRINTPVFVPLNDVNIQALATSVLSIRFKIPVIEGFGELIGVDSYGIVNGVELDFAGTTYSDDFITTYIPIPLPDQIPEPVVTKLYIVVSNGTDQRKYEYISAGQVFTTGDISTGTTHTLTATAQNV